jgi:glutaredoxin
LTLSRTKCPHCRKRLEPDQRIHPACIEGYAEALQAKADRVNARKARELAKLDRALVRERKAALKTIPDLIKEADRVFAAWVRERDRQAGHPCISSGQPLDWSGNQVDAGHYRSRGAASHLRYHPDNCHAQTKRDNRYLAGNAIDYRMGLIERIGLSRVEALEANNSPHKWQRDELLRIIEQFKAALKELRKQEA